MAEQRADEDQLDRPVAERVIREAEIAAGRVRRFRHGMSVLLIPPFAWVPVIVRQVIPLSDCSAAAGGFSAPASTAAAGQRLRWRRATNPYQRLHVNPIRIAQLDVLASLSRDGFARLHAVVTRTLVY